MGNGPNGERASGDCRCLNLRCVGLTLVTVAIKQFFLIKTWRSTTVLSRDTYLLGLLYSRPSAYPTGVETGVSAGREIH